MLIRLKYQNGRTIRRLILFSICALLIYLIATSSSIVSSSKEVAENNISEEGPVGLNRREAKIESPFHWIENRRQQALQRAAKSGFWKGLFNFPPFRYRMEQDEVNLLVNWDNVSMAERCRYIMDTTYAVNEGWTNLLNIRFYGEDEVDDLLISLLGERLRYFDYCFLSGGLTFEEVFNVKSIIDPQDQHKSSPYDFLHRMFPFLRKVENDEQDPFWPLITDLTSGKVQPIPPLPLDFNKNFWSNWLKMSHGKGIVLTLSENDKYLFFKQLKVLQHMGNTLPIQLLTAGGEISEEFIEELSLVVKATTQKVYLVDCTRVLDPKYAKEYISFFINKWLAVIFNTFEEIVLLDADVVPFVNIEQFLSNPKYKSTGILLFKDRSMPKEHTFSYCVDMLRGVEPSYQENKLIGSNIMYYSGDKQYDSSEEALVYQRFSHDLLLHHVDSGLVVINKVRNLNGLLFSFMLNLDGKMARCVYGDKEIFWLGQLYAGQKYSIYPIDGSIVGPLIENVKDDTSQKIYQICGAQIAHSDESDELLWTNGGLKTCKIPESAESDFQKASDYFKERYKDVDTLKKIYDSPLRMEGLIMPEVHEEPWLQIKECSNYMYCATATQDNNDVNLEHDIGHVVKFNQKTSKRLNEISAIWNQS